jgi:large subunit ribosomal protein L10
MNRDQKAVAIAEIADHIRSSQAIFAVDYQGISVPQAAELRAKLRESDATFKIVKNSLTERAATETEARELIALLQGPTALTFVRGDIATAAKSLADYGRATQLLPFKGGLMNGAPLEPEQIRALSRLPSREVLYGQLVGVVASPISGLVRSLGGLLGGLAVALGQVQAKKQSGELPAGDVPSVSEASASGDSSAALAADESPTAEADTAAAKAPAGEAEPAAEEPAAEADTQSEPEQEQDQPAQEDDDNQADAAAEDQSEDAEANPPKED